MPLYLCLLKDLEKDYNPKDLAKFLLGQNPELLQQSVNIKPALNRSAFVLIFIVFIMSKEFKHFEHSADDCLCLLDSVWSMMTKSLL